MIIIEIHSFQFFKFYDTEISQTILIISIKHHFCYIQPVNK